MNAKNRVQMLLGALNLLAVSSPMFLGPIAHAANREQKAEALNVASMKSMESTWLKVPIACKARQFNASPASLANTEVASNIQNIYASFGA